MAKTASCALSNAMPERIAPQVKEVLSGVIRKYSASDPQCGGDIDARHDEFSLARRAAVVGAVDIATLRDAFTDCEASFRRKLHFQPHDHLHPPLRLTVC